MARKVNPRIRTANEPVEITPQQVQEFKRCAEDVVYFCEHYAKVQHPVKGSVSFKLYDYQKDMLRLYQNEMYVIIKSARQSGKCLSHEATVSRKKTPEKNLINRFKKFFLKLINRRLYENIFNKNM